MSEYLSIESLNVLKEVFLKCMWVLSDMIEKLEKRVELLETRGLK